MDKTKILVLAELYWPQGGGAELATHLMLKNLQKTGKFQITVLTGVRSIEKISGIKYIYTPHLKPRPKPLLWFYVDYMCRQEFFRNLLKKHDVVYIPRIAYPAIPYSKKLGKKVIVHLHNYQPLTYHSIYSEADEKLNNPIKFEILEHNNILRSIAVGFLQHLNKFVKYWLLQADKVICVSEKQKSIIIKRIPELAKKIEVIYNVLPDVPAIVRKNISSSAILYLGGDSYLKGFHLLLGALKVMAKKSSPQLKIIFAGKYNRRSKKLLKRLSKVIKNIVFEGYVTHSELWKLYSLSKAVIVPSICEEPLPLIILESIVSGTIPIASKVGGIPEIIRGTYAEKLLFTCNDINELVNKIGFVLSLTMEEFMKINAELNETLLKNINNNEVGKKLIDIFSN